MVRLAPLLLPLALLGPAAGPAFATGERDTGTPARTGCSDQVLVGGVQLPEDPYLYTLINADHAWGIPDLVDLIVDTATRMKELLPFGSPIVVGDLSARRGGVLYPHKSHRGGVDADIGLYQGGAWQPKGILPFPATDLDVAANFMLIATLLASGRVDLILLDRTHIATIRSWALANGELEAGDADFWFPPTGSRREKQGAGVVRHAPGHDGHLHVRVLCPDGSRAR